MPPNSQAALDQLRSFQGSRRKSTDVLRDSENRLGLPQATQRQQGLRTAITNTENLIKAVEPSVSGRTGGSLVTEAQKTRLVGMERAPLDTAFGEQNRALEGENAMANELQRRALQESQLQIAEDDRQEQGMSGLYSTLYQREQDAQAKAERDRAFAEEQSRARAAAAQNSALQSLLAGGGNNAQTSTPTGAQMVKQGNGFAFVNEFGNPISAATYAATKGIPFRDLLGIMAKQGDTGATAALGFTGNDYGYDPGKIGNNSALYNALVWGTGKQYQQPGNAGNKGASGGGW